MTTTLHDVAALAGLSIATVSRVVNGLPVSADSLARVNQAIAELGYVPNEAARALRTERTLTIGVIFADLRNTLGIELLDALSEAVEDGGYSLLISTARGDEGRYDLLMRRFLERRIDGLFCVRPPATSESLARYLALNIPVITMFERGAAFADLPLVRPAFNEGASEAARFLYEQGHRQVAVVRPDGRSPAMMAMVEALRAEGLAVATPEQAPGTSTADIVAGLQATKATAVVVTDPQVRGLLAALSQAGVQVPGDVSVLSVDQVAAESYHRRHGISSLTIDPHHVGKTAGSLMLDWLAGTKPALKVRVQHAQFSPRETIGLEPGTPA